MKEDKSIEDEWGIMTELVFGLWECKEMDGERDNARKNWSCW